MLTSFFEKSIMDQKFTFDMLTVHFSVSNNSEKMSLENIKASIII